VYNKVEIRVFGPRRSGNHAIINWLAYQAPEKIHFFNCASNRGHDPYRTGKCRGDQYHEKLQLVFEQIPNLKNEDDDVVQYWRDIDKDVLMYSYEDIDMDKYVKPRSADFPIDRKKITGESDYQIDVVILRDPFNWLASKLKYNTKKYDYRTYSILAPRYKPNRNVRNKMPYYDTYPGYKEDAKKLEGKTYINLDKLVNIWTSHIRAINFPHEYGLYNVVFINYNLWAVNYHYRQSLIENHFKSCGFKFTDKGKDEIAVRGGGSSFDGHNAGTDASNMDVLNRWKYFKNNKLFDRIFEFYPVLGELSKKTFGNVHTSELEEDEENIITFMP
jgi:hypothetical protein